MKGNEMISIDDLVSTCRAIELLSHGVDISQLDTLKQYWNIKDNKLQSKLSPNVARIAKIKLDESVTDYLQWPIGAYFVREGVDWLTVFEENLTDEEKAETTINVDLDTFKGVMKVLKIKNFAQYSDIDIATYYPEYYEELAKARAEFDTKDLTDCQMVEELSLANNRTNLIAMLMCSEYPKEVGEAVLKAYDNPDKDFEIDALKDYEVIDNRIYIKVPPMDLSAHASHFTCNKRVLENIKYIVISRNPYDYYFCSYGSNIQSCYSINGTNHGWHGAVPLSAVKGSYIIYGADNKCNKINIINGKKWNVPHMYFRAWGWLSKDGRLLVDRAYPDPDLAQYDRDEILDLLTPFLKYDVFKTCKKPITTELKYGKELCAWWRSYEGHMYPDSTSYWKADSDEIVYRGICYGTRNFIGTCPLNRSLLNIMHDISSIDDNIQYADDYQIVNGVLSHARKCPITNLPILPEETVSPFAKMFKDKVDGDVLVGTYCDGYFKADISSIKISDNCGSKIRFRNMNNESSWKDGSTINFRTRFSCDTVPIKVFKETITGAVKSSHYKYVIMRYIEGDRVTYVKYRG